MPAWQRRRILIWGKTRPELSKTYREIVCTGGVFEDTKELVRLYPIPLRFMDDKTTFAKYNVIDADVMRNTSDPRPESHKIRYDTIKVVDNVKTRPGGNWDARANWLFDPGNLYASVEDLQQWQSQNGRSLGILKPHEVTKVEASIIGASEKTKFMASYDEAMAQLELDDPNRLHARPLTPPDYRFLYTFSCDGKCKHTMSVLDWEIDAFYWRMKMEKGGETKAANEVVDTLKRYATEAYDLRFFLGNISSHPHVFTIVGLWYPKRQAQGSFAFEDVL
jgi:hypothetical protein